MKRGPKPTLLVDRFWGHVDKSGGPDACWPFTGSVDKKGYGRIKDDGRRTGIGAHRVAYRLANPDELAPAVLDHVCHDPKTCAGGRDCEHRRCCNPTHLQPSTSEANSAVGRQSSYLAARTHCTNGHEWTARNTGWRSSRNGRLARRCRACDAANRRRHKAAAA